MVQKEEMSQTCVRFVSTAHEYLAKCTLGLASPPHIRANGGGAARGGVGMMNFISYFALELLCHEQQVCISFVRRGPAWPAVVEKLLDWVMNVHRALFASCCHFV